MYIYGHRPWMEGKEHLMSPLLPAIGDDDAAPLSRTPGGSCF